MRFAGSASRRLFLARRDPERSKPLVLLLSRNTEGPCVSYRRRHEGTP
jgi:hypothetical protein